MRLTSEFWLTALIKKIRAQGGFVYLVRRGAEEAGVIFIRQVLTNGEVALYGPAPQSLYDEKVARGDRLFIHLLTATEQKVDVKLKQEVSFDPDIWIVEIENYFDLENIGQLGLISEE